jgi:hypothetical protein
MNHKASRRFWSCVKRLRETYGIWPLSSTDDPAQTPLSLKIGNLWSVRIGTHFRALAVEAESELIWVWIGKHADYDHLVAGGGC